jgi:acid phosphatase type 7
VSRRLAVLLLVVAACAIALLVAVAASRREDPPAAVPDTAGHATVEGVRVAAGGDIACDPGSSFFEAGQGTDLTCRQLATSNTLVRGHYAAVLTLGDTQYEDGAYEKFVASYDPSWGRVKSITKPAPGNHEYRSSGASGYFRYFGMAAGDPTKGYYSFDVGGWHMIALNSNCSEVGGCDAGSPQEEWLRDDLAAHPAACTLAYWHHPRFSSGSHGSDSTYTAFWQALYDAGADVVLGGHDHDYERFAAQTPSGDRDSRRGLRQFVVGSGGKELRPFSTNRANSETRNATSLGVLELTLGAHAYAWRFLPAVGSFTDSGSTDCH